MELYDHKLLMRPRTERNYDRCSSCTIFSEICILIRHSPNHNMGIITLSVAVQALYWRLIFVRLSELFLLWVDYSISTIYREECKGRDVMELSARLYTALLIADIIYITTWNTSVPSLFPSTFFFFQSFFRLCQFCTTCFLDLRLWYFLQEMHNFRYCLGFCFFNT